MLYETVEPGVVHPENDRQHWPGGEGEHAERDEIDQKLLRGHWPHFAFAHTLVYLQLESLEQNRSDVRGVGADGVCQQAVNSIRIVMKLGDEIAGHKEVLRQYVEVDSGQPLDFLVEGGVGGQRLYQSGEDPRCGLLENCGAEALLAPEVVVKERLIDARLSGDLLHSGAGGAAPQEHRARGFEYTQLGGFFPRLAPSRRRSPTAPGDSLARSTTTSWRDLSPGS